MRSIAGASEALAGQLSVLTADANGARGSAAPKLGCPRRLGARRGRLVLRIGLIFARWLSVGCEQQALFDRDLMVSIRIRHGDIEAAGHPRDRRRSSSRRRPASGHS